MRSEFSLSRKSFVLKKIEKVGHPPDIFHMKRTSISWKSSRYYGYHKTPSLFPHKKSGGENGQRNQKGSKFVRKENRGEKMRISSLLAILFLDKKQHWSFCIMMDSKIWLKEWTMPMVHTIFASDSLVSVRYTHYLVVFLVNKNWNTCTYFFQSHNCN